MRRATCAHASRLPTLTPPLHHPFPTHLSYAYSYARSTISRFSTRADVAHEEEVLSALRNVVGPGGGEDVVRQGLVRNLRVNAAAGVVRFQFGSNDAWLQQRCLEALQALPWVKQVPVIERSLPLSTPAADTTQGLDKVKHIVAVSSCKGGVGKSTVAVNLACALHALGHVVGLVDADVYGPSLPRMMVSDEQEWAVGRSPDKKMILPLELHGLRCMSYGFVAPGTGGRGEKGSQKGLEGSAAMLRGPMVSSIVAQICNKTMWGELDFLVVDMPPGTGDIHLTLCQELKRIDAAVIVTTPQQLSFVDVVKGIDMFMQLKVPTVAVVENMAYFVGDDEKVYRPFGDGHVETLKQRYGIKHSYALPISRETSSAGDSGVPFVKQFPNAPLSETYKDLASGVVDEVDRLQSIAAVTSPCQVR